MVINNNLCKLNEENYPIIEDDKVCFVYRGKADQVSVVGDFNDWEPVDNMIKLKSGDLWYLNKKVPRDARIDYKFIVDHDWISDPLNKSINNCHYSYNSTLIMPEYNNNFDLIRATNAPKGCLISKLKFESISLGRSMNYKIYLPDGFKEEKINNFIYVIDGNEYLDMGGMSSTIDYLIYKGYMPKSVVVLIDPGERTNEYKLNENYINYIKNELIPHIENTYTLCRDYIQRTVIGASWGGLTAMYIAMTTDNLINKVISQSGTLWAKNWMIFDVISKVAQKKIDICIQTGIKNETELMNYKMSNLLKSKGYNVIYQKFNEGDNWANWGNHLFDALKAVYECQENEDSEDTEDFDETLYDLSYWG
ncbi:MAG: alpha/beta hydrolase-fold protein [Bacillota bacterium]|nr:alpha/beta hydrolase-fold protein [Bacillota bacterium]